MVFETLIGGHFGEDAIFLSCDALSSLDLGHFVPIVHSPTLPRPHPSSGAPAPGPRPERLGKVWWLQRSASNSS